LVVADGDPERRKMSHFSERPPTIGEKVIADPEEYDQKPTTEELATLRRVSDRIPKRAFIVAIVELVERMS
jgi:POT family proton-dependent oligopeptide transporter